MHIKIISNGVTVLSVWKKWYRKGNGDDRMDMGKILVIQACHWKDRKFELKWI
jgi:hypothetical protein